MLQHLFTAAFLLPSLVLGQLSGNVGPLTSVAAKKAKKLCNVLDYGAKADNMTDLGPALSSAFNACKEGGLLYVPSGTYLLSTFPALSGANAWALQLDGMVYRNTKTLGGNLLGIDSSTDFELFSSHGQGMLQGQGYVMHATGATANAPRMIRLTNVSDFSIHEVKLVDSPSFHIIMDSCSNGEVYNTLIRGGDMGGLDGIDIAGNNIWVHDVEVTNKDECVTIKTPSNNIQVENIYCNWSGGCAIGSLGSDTAISNILYRNVYTWTSNQMFMIKSNGGDGSVENVLFDNFIGHRNAYSLQINQYWTQRQPDPGAGVKLNNITFSKWYGDEVDGAQRGPIDIACADGTPCSNIAIKDFAMWTDTGDTQWYACRSAYGSGFCLRSGDETKSYIASTSTVSTAPPGYSATSMPYDIVTPTWGTASPVPSPDWPTSFFPGTPPISTLAAG